MGPSAAASEFLGTVGLSAELPTPKPSSRGRHVALGVRFPGHEVLADPAWPLPVLEPRDPPARELFLASREV